MFIEYREGYKYQLNKNVKLKTPIVGERVHHKYFDLYADGTLEIREGYAWDGPSGPTLDTQDSLGPSLVHDVFCQMMRLELLSYNKWQDTVNEFFREHCKRCGMNAFRAWYWYRAVEFADAGRPDGKDPNPVLTAPI